MDPICILLGLCLKHFILGGGTIFKNYLFDCADSSLLQGFSLVAESRGSSNCSMQASYCGGIFGCRTWVLGLWASVVATCGFSSCGAQA